MDISDKIQKMIQLTSALKYDALDLLREADGEEKTALERYYWLLSKADDLMNDNFSNCWKCGTYAHVSALKEDAHYARYNCMEHANK